MENIQFQQLVDILKRKEDSALLIYGIVYKKKEKKKKSKILDQQSCFRAVYTVIKFEIETIYSFYVSAFHLN